MEETTIKGQVIRASSNKYTVDLGNEIAVINARGKIKYFSGDIITGDFVEVEDGAITKVYPRYSRFIRPNVANVNTLCIIISNPPSPDYLIVDKLLLSANFSNVECAIVINKCDLGEGTAAYVKKHYDFLPTYIVSAKTGEGINDLKNYLNDRSVVFAGQSAVGKTSILNNLLNTDYRTGTISKKSERGRHTTTGSQILKGANFLLFDTPGFSEITVDISPQDAVMNFPPYDNYLSKCKYLDCTHSTEPDCYIKELVANGTLSKDRHQRYCEIIQEIKRNYETRYGNKKK